MFMSDRRLFAVLLCLVLVVVCSAKETKRPNFLFVLVDDQSPFDLKVYNPRSSLDSPVIDRIASVELCISTSSSDSSLNQRGISKD